MSLREAGSVESRTDRDNITASAFSHPERQVRNVATEPPESRRQGFQSKQDPIQRVRCWAEVVRHLGAPWVIDSRECHG
jgi:hypothetical protein